MVLKHCEFCREEIKGLEDYIEARHKMGRTSVRGPHASTHLLFAHLHCFSKNTPRRKENEIKLKS